MNQDEFVRLSRLIDEVNQLLDAEDKIEQERTERGRTERPRRLCTRCRRNARVLART